MATPNNQPLYLKIIGTLITVIGILIYDDIQKMKVNIETLLLQDKVNTTQGQNFERRLTQIEQKIAINMPFPKDPPEPSEPLFTKFLFTNDHKFNIIPKS